MVASTLLLLPFLCFAGFLFFVFLSPFVGQLCCRCPFFPQPQHLMLVRCLFYFSANCRPNSATLPVSHRHLRSRVPLLPSNY